MYPTLGRNSRLSGLYRAQWAYIAAIKDAELSKREDITPTLKEVLLHRRAPPFTAKYDIARGVFHFLQTLVGFVAMLIVM